jgi:hypothetical protein
MLEGQQRPDLEIDSSGTETFDVFEEGLICRTARSSVVRGRDEVPLQLTVAFRILLG